MNLNCPLLETFDINRSVFSKVLEYRAVPNGKGAVEVRRRVATSAEGPIDHIQV